MPPPNPTTGPPRSAPAEQDPATWVRGAQVAFDPAPSAATETVASQVVMPIAEPSTVYE